MKFGKKALPLVFLGVILAVGLVFKLALASLISPSFLEDFLEENLNCEASVEGVKVSLWQREVQLRGLELREKGEADSTAPAVAVEGVDLGVRLIPLLGRRLETTSFIIRQPSLRTSLNEEGDLSLAEIFRSSEDEDESEDEEDPSSTKKSKEGILKAQKNQWLAKLEETRLEDGRIELTFEKEKLKLEVEGLSITVSDLQFNPEDLVTLNQVAMELAGDCQLFDARGELLVRLDLAGAAQGELFDEVSGDFDADIIADLALGKDSHVNPRVKVVRQTWGLVGQVRKLGINLGDLPQRVEFGRSRRIKGSYTGGTVHLIEPLSLTVGKWELGLAGDSWIETFSGQHEIGIEFLAGEKVSELLGGWMSRLPREAQGFVADRFVDQEQVLWRVNSSGDLKDPDLDFLSQLPEHKGILKDLEDEFEGEIDQLKDEAKKLFRGLLGGDD